MKLPLLAFLVLSLAFPICIHGQINDCADAEVVCSDAHLEFNPDGPGYDDYADPDNDPGCIVALEQNSAWYYFEIDPLAPPNLVLGFIIHPLGGYGEDYDWALYGPDVDCNDLGSPIRCSSSSFMCGFCPETGMGMGTTDVTEGPGTGDGFVMTLIVQPGQGYYLMIDNWLGTDNGFILEWTDTAAPYLNCNASPPCALNALAGDDFSACEGDQVPLNGSSTGNHENESYVWSGTNGGTGFLNDPNISSPIVNLPPGFTGTIVFTLTVTEDTCMSMDEMELTIEPLPDVTINPAGPFCPTDNPYFLTATPAGGTWGGAATGSQFNPVLNGPGIHTVTYTYTDANSCTTVEEIDIEVYEAPEVVIDPSPASFCDSENEILLTATGSGGAGSYMYNWTTPTEMADGATYNATVGGIHTVTVTDANGCTSTNAVTVVTYANPEVTITDPGPLCASSEYFQVSANPPGGEFSGSIISPEGDITPNTITPGTYSISYSYIDGNNCEGIDNLNITIIPVPEAIAGNNGPLCEGQLITLSGETNSMGSVITYNWTGPNGFVSNVQNPSNVTDAGNYNLQVIVDGCPSAVAVTTVVLHSQPDAFASNGGPYCNNEPILLFGSTSFTGNTITYAWTGPNGYTSDVQNPTDATEPGLYSLVINVDGCPSIVATTDVIFSQQPNVSASNTGPYCEGEAIALFGNTNASGNVITYAWSGPGGYTSAAQNPTDATLPGMYQLIINVDGCPSPLGTTQVIINPNPQPVITGQSSFCTGFSATIDAGAGYASYLWNNGSQTQTQDVTVAGTYDVTVTSSSGCTGVASFVVTENSSLSPVITGALGFCEGTSTVLDAGAGYVSYAWASGETSQTIVVTTGGNQGVIVTDADGCTGSAIVTTIENPNPTVTIGGSTTYCIGGSTVLDAGAGYASYAWSNAANSQTITVSAPGTFSVDVIDMNGCPGSATVSVNESTSLSPVITGGLAFCENGSTTLNAGSGFASYLWSDGSINQTLTVNATGLYSVTVSDGVSCTGEATVAVTEVLPPVAQVKTTTSLCNTIAGGSIINLYDLVISGDAGGSWEDLDNSGAGGLFTSLNFNGIAAGDYTFRYTTNSAMAPCPESSYLVIVTVIDCACPDVLFFNAAPLCNAGDVLDLATLENTTEPGTWALIQTPPGSTPSTLNGNIFTSTGGDPGTYTLQFTLQNQPPPGCPSDFQVTVDVDDAVDAGTALQPLAFCVKDDQLAVLTDLISGEDANGVWAETSAIPSSGNAFNAANGTFATLNQSPGNYQFEYAIASNGACPGDVTSVSVVINPAPVAVAVDEVIIDCKNPTQSLDATGSSSGPAYDIAWTGPGIVIDGNENTLQPTVNQQGNYVLLITNNITGCTNTTMVNVIANTDPPTSAVIDNQSVSCFGMQDAFIHVTDVLGGEPSFLYSLDNAPFTDNSDFNSLSAGDYSLVIEDANGCRWDTVITLVEPAQINIDLGPDIELGLGETATVIADHNVSLNLLDTLIWSPDNAIECIDVLCFEATVGAFNSVNLSATVIDFNGCTATDDIFILVNKNRKLYIPTAFSPDGDGINDIFYIFGDNDQIVEIKKFLIFNRWGGLVYEAVHFLPNDPGKGWDGDVKNEAVNPGVFTYVAEIEYIDGVVELVTGDVTVVK